MSRDREAYPLPGDVHVRVMADLAGLRRDVHGEVNALMVGMPERPGDLVTITGPARQRREPGDDLLIRQRDGRSHHATMSRNCPAVMPGVPQLKTAWPRN
jgi:hypothetical protein